MAKPGRRPGPTETRERILAAAAARFTTSGYDGTSVRQVAADAAVDPALIRHFFGSKERLFTEVVAAVVRPAEAVTGALAGPRSGLGVRLVRFFLGLLGDVRRPGPLLGLIRSAVTSEPAAALMREFLADEVLGRIAATVRPDSADLRAALAASQLVGLAIARYAVGLKPLRKADVDELVAWVAPTVQRYLTSPAPV